jgi:SAM-dependent methyltransferase
MMNRRAFLDRCAEISHPLGHQGESYLDEHADRLYATYRTCGERLDSGSLLSIGAGSAFVESALSAGGASVTVIDFPEGIDLNAAYYEACGLTAVAADASDPSALLSLGTFDMVLAAEIIEHVPVAPSVLLRNWSRCVDPGGRLVVTTPNLGSLPSLLRLLFMRPLLPPPERSFGPVSFENEGVHRREYMPSEIESALIAADLEPELISFALNHRPRNAKEFAYLPAQLFPRFRPTMIAVARKPETRASSRRGADCSGAADDGRDLPRESAHR